MIINILMILIGFGLVYLALDKFKSWKPVNIIFAFFGGGFLIFVGTVLIIALPIFSFIKKVTHVE